MILSGMQTSLWLSLREANLVTRARLASHREQYYNALLQSATSECQVLTGLRFLGDRTAGSHSSLRLEGSRESARLFERGLFQCRIRPPSRQLSQCPLVDCKPRCLPVP